MSIIHFFTNETIMHDFSITSCVSPVMLEKIQFWQSMIKGNAYWNKKAKSCGILNQIASKLSTLVEREIALQIDNDAIREPMENLNAHVGLIVEYIALLGSCVMRPVFSNGKIQFELLPMGNYLPMSYDFDGTLQKAMFIKELQDDFVLVEENNYQNGSQFVESVLYKNDNGKLKRVSLQACEQTRLMQPLYEWRNCKFPLFVEFRNISHNNIDGSLVPVPIISGVENLIREADEQFERMLWEQKAGEARVFADSDLFRKHQVPYDANAAFSQSQQLTQDLSRLLVMVDGDGTADGKNRIVEHAPQLRTASQNEMLQQIFRRIELACGIGKGTISDAESVQQTATQYSGGRQELFAIIDKFENEIEKKYKQSARVFAHYANAYGLGSIDANVFIKWNDAQTRKDIEKAKQIAMQELNNGVLNEWEYRRDFFGESEEVAKMNAPEKEASGGLF